MELFTNLDAQSLYKFIDKTRAENNLRNGVKTEDIADMLVEALKEYAMKNKKNNMCAIGMEDDDLKKAIIKAIPHVEEWKNSKKKTESKEQKKTEQKTEKKTEKKEKETGFDLTQLELF